MDSHGVPRSIVDCAEYAECAGVCGVRRSTSEYTECLEYHGVLQSAQSIVENYGILGLCRVGGVQWSAVEYVGVLCRTMECVEYKECDGVSGVLWITRSMRSVVEYAESTGVLWSVAECCGVLWSTMEYAEFEEYEEYAEHVRSSERHLDHVTRGPPQYITI